MSRYKLCLKAGRSKPKQNKREIYLHILDLFIGAKRGKFVNLKTTATTI